MLRAAVVGLGILLYLSAGATLAARPADYDPDVLWSVESMQEMLAQAERALEQEMGRPLKPKPRVVLGNPEFVAKQLVPDIRKSVRARGKNLREGEIQLIALYTAASVFGLHLKHAVYLVPEVFERAAESDSRFLDRNFVLAVLIHELVHDYDDIRYNIGARLKKVEGEDLFIFKALGEGHAQYVTERAMSRLGLIREFTLLERAHAGISTADKTMLYYADIAQADFNLAYVQGWEFFKGLRDVGQAGFEDKVFNKPPKSLSVIYNPMRYYYPRTDVAARGDLKAILKKAVPSPMGWKKSDAPYTEHDLRTELATFLPKAKVALLGPQFVQGAAIAAMPPTLSNPAAIECNVVQAASPQWAREIVKAKRDVQESRDATAKTATWGMAKVIHSEFGTLAAARKIENVWGRRVLAFPVKYLGKKGATSENWLAFAYRDYVVDCLFSDYSRGEKQLTETMSSFIESIRAQESAPAVAADN